MFKKLLLIVTAIIAVSLNAELNQMRIVGQAERKPNEIVANRYQTVNRETAACLIFKTDLTVDIDFRPNGELVDIVNPATGQYHVYLAPGIRWVDIHAFGYSPLTVVLRDYGISNLRSRDVYELQLTGDRRDYTADRDLFTVQFSIEPEDLYISHNNNAPVPVRGNVARFRLVEGTHRFTFSKPGYEDQDIELNVSENITESVSLARGTSAARLDLQGFAVIESEPVGAEVFLNEQFVGVTPFMRQLVAGEYHYTISIPLYNSERGTFSLAQGETVNLPKVTLVPRFGTISIRSNPQGADVLLNGSNRGKTPIEHLRLDSSDYELEIRLSMYHTHSESFLLSDGENKNLNIRLKPAFGELVIESSPEQGAKVFIDEREVGTTPYRNQRQPSGRYVVRLQKELYSPATRQIEIRDEQTTRETISLQPNFGTVTIISEGAEIFVDNRSVGRNRYQARLPQGRYSLTAKKERHLDAQENIFVQVGDTREVSLEPQPRQGAVSIASQPFESRGAEIFVNDAKRNEVTPAVIPLLMGNYQVSLRHRDFLEQTRQVTINEGQTTNLEFNMQTYRGSMQAKANFWKTSKWVALTGTFIAIAGAVYFDLEGQNYIEEYNSTGGPIYRKEAWENAEKSLDNRDLFIYVSIVPAAYTFYSWIRQASYNRKTR